MKKIVPGPTRGDLTRGGSGDLNMSRDLFESGRWTRRSAKNSSRRQRSLNKDMINICSSAVSTVRFYISENILHETFPLKKFGSGVRLHQIWLLCKAALEGGGAAISWVESNFIAQTLAAPGPGLHQARTSLDRRVTRLIWDQLLWSETENTAWVWETTFLFLRSQQGGEAPGGAEEHRTWGRPSPDLGPHLCTSGSNQSGREC